MERRSFLAGAGGSLAATLAGCLEERAEADCEERLQDDDTTSEEQFLQEGERPESEGAEEFLATVAEVTGGRTGFDGRDDTWRIRFSETEGLWTIEYFGAVGGNEDRFHEEIAALAIAFATHRPAGVSLKATANHECSTGTWHVCAETAAAYERGDIDRETFAERVQRTAETMNNC
jgi:hypothetical protein